ncbi:MAG TPA: energy transducer TonB [Candidatus Sulfotelmatobacter sp.]|nr:energy transducer TonB [Candidatus Sulfotelmatobacter sp.]
MVPDSTRLEPIKVVKADYPLEARVKGLQGTAWLLISVAENGDVSQVEVISGEPVFTQAAVSAAKKWKFKPFVRDGKPVAVSTKVPFDFAFTENLHDEKPPSTELKPVNQSDEADAIPQRVRVSQGVSVGMLIHKVQPVYPIEARRNGIQGTVVLRAVINTEGRIESLSVISGPKELTQAAIGAVQQWRYRPYLLAGKPVVADTQVQVNFQLKRN